MALAPSVRLILKAGKNKALGECYQGQPFEKQGDLVSLLSLPSTETGRHQALRGQEPQLLGTNKGRQTSPLMRHLLL